MLQRTNQAHHGKTIPFSGASGLNSGTDLRIASLIGNDCLTDILKEHQTQLSVLHLLVMAHQFEISGRTKPGAEYRQSCPNEYALDPFKRIFIQPSQAMR